MWFNRVGAEGVFCYVVIAAATGLAGCADSCFFGYFNSGTGVVVVGAANTTPPCSLKQAKPAMNVIALKSIACEDCTSDARVEHLFVTIRSIQLNPATDHASQEWVEIAPELADKPQSIDLIGNSLPETILENRDVNADTYRNVRVRFCRDSDSNEECQAESACGRTLRNCTVIGDGRIEPFYWPGSAPELVMPVGITEGNPLAILPDSIVDLRLSLDLQRAFTNSSIQRSGLENVLVGRATAVRRWSIVANNPE